ncbi:transglutaminase N-terminal domain-containing protein [Roseomonas sp. CCTCC AB2023176]|uniref:transglutaminase family protein n=1 Tax=Roseomonas sp. CCTCC AB2023176 TaxID=3342640 RepID=UPI0035E20A6B
MNWRVRHVTSYAYSEPVEMAMHLLHLLPRDLPRQAVRRAALVADPAPARREDGTDHFGNRATWLTMDRPHTRFSVTAEYDVAVEPRPSLPAATPGWEDVAALARREADLAEFLFESPLLPAVAGARDHIAACFPSGRPVGEALQEVARRFRDGLTFRPGATTVSTPVADVLRRRAGVCQDFAHLLITGLRMLGVPARYVSGTIRTRPPPGGVRRLGVDQSHAWVAAWAGPEAGWVDIDPTNAILVADEHVTLGWGRDFGDVSPLRGVILGGGRHTVSVSVDMEPAEATAA